jgi:hypothetical protein
LIILNMGRFVKPLVVIKTIFLPETNLPISSELLGENTILVGL